MEGNQLHFRGLAPFDMDIKYCELDSKAPENTNDAHIHDTCEIYLNLTGDISFMVEDHIYPVSRGNVIFTRPNEYHHCIYHSNALHKHFWILFSAAGNEQLLGAFFNRAVGEKNLIALPGNKGEELIALCFALLKDEEPESAKLLNFLRLMALLEEGQGTPVKTQAKYLPPDVLTALDYMNHNLTSDLSASVLAAAACVSVNTLERHFRAAFQLTPTELIQQKRLAMSAELLRNGSSVQEAAMGSGFSDCSYFIGLFRKMFRMTPLAYKKKYCG